MQSLLPLAAPVVAFLVGRSAIRIACRAALAWGFVDNPDQRRKLHGVPIPLGGGIAVWLATWSGWAVREFALKPAGTNDGADLRFCGALGVASLILLILGVIDDRYGMRGRHKLLGQFIAAAVLVCFGLQIDALRAFGVTVELGHLSYPVTVLWILVVVNAFNLIDGMDGFCGSMALVACVALVLMTSGSEHAADMSIELALAGAIVAFLWDNLPPAKIYLGDAGSMTIGMLIAALSVRATSGGPDRPTPLLPLLAIVALPLLDVVTAFVRRSLTGRSIFTPDRGHLHHLLRNRLGTTVAALAAAIALAALGAAGAAASRVSRLGDLAPSLGVLFSFALLVGTNTFGTSESRLLLFWARTALSPILRGRMMRETGLREECHLHGIEDWAQVWDVLIREVELIGGIGRVELSIDIAAAGEVYHGLWCSPSISHADPVWTVVHTLHAGEVPAGQLRLAGCADARECGHLHKVDALVRGLELRLLPFAPASARPDVSGRPVTGAAELGAPLPAVNFPAATPLA